MCKRKRLKNSDHIRNLGVIIDNELNFQHHITAILQTAFNHLENISCFLSQCDPRCARYPFASPADAVTLPFSVYGQRAKAHNPTRLILMQKVYVSLVKFRHKASVKFG